MVEKITMKQIIIIVTPFSKFIHSLNFRIEEKEKIMY